MHPMGCTDPLGPHGPIRATRGVCATPCPACSLPGSGTGFGYPVQGLSRIRDLRASSAAPWRKNEGLADWLRALSSRDSPRPRGSQSHVGRESASVTLFWFVEDRIHIQEAMKIG